MASYWAWREMGIRLINPYHTFWVSWCRGTMSRSRNNIFIQVISIFLVITPGRLREILVHLSHIFFAHVLVPWTLNGTWRSHPWLIIFCNRCRSLPFFTSRDYYSKFLVMKFWCNMSTVWRVSGLLSDTTSLLDVQHWTGSFQCHLS